MLDSAGVLVDRRPKGHLLRIEGAVALVWTQVAIPVPGRVDERVHGIGLAPCRSSALRATGIDERLVRDER
ncbi:hypothetical protein HRbin27_01105 [bacterium HR27]|nr:hypothetical protein HRbin27_01105 [bacterium HR27]